MADVAAKGLYDDLGIEPDADGSEIAAAHRARVKVHHPDAGGNREDFERVQRAYVVLRDPAKREKYDRTGQVDDAPDNEAALIAEHFLSAFDRAMAKGSATTRDIIASAKAILRNDMSEMGGTLRQARAEQKAIGEATGRVTFTGSGVNVIAKMLEGRKAAVDIAITQMEQRKARMIAALAMADDYQWKRDETIAPVWMTATT